jgi:hypothetical protein
VYRWRRQAATDRDGGTWVGPVVGVLPSVRDVISCEDLRIDFPI